jgi:hypothetical protein
MFPECFLNVLWMFPERAGIQAAGAQTWAWAWPGRWEPSAVVLQRLCGPGEVSQSETPEWGIFPRGANQKHPNVKYSREEPIRNTRMWNIPARSQSETSEWGIFPRGANQKHPHVKYSREEPIRNTWMRNIPARSQSETPEWGIFPRGANQKHPNVKYSREEPIRNTRMRNIPGIGSLIGNRASKPHLATCSG